MIVSTNVSLTHTAINSGDSVRVLCNKVTASGTKNNIATPNATGTDLVQVQTQSFENPVYKMDGIHYKNESGILTYADVLTLYKSQYNGSNAITLNVTYGGDSPVSLVSASDTVSTDISVILKSFNLPIDVTNSKDSYMPVGTLTFQETD